MEYNNRIMNNMVKNTLPFTYISLIKPHDIDNKLNTIFST